MAAFIEWIDKLSDPKIPEKLTQANIHRTCKTSGNQAIVFRLAVAKFEYDISAICQRCQEKYLKL